MHYTVVRESSHQIWWPKCIAKQIDPYLTPADPFMIFDPSNALHYGQGFFPPNLVAIGHCYANWPLFDPSWPLHDLWPQQCIMLWSGILGGHRAFPSNLTSGWPLHDLWPQQCTTLWLGVLLTKFGSHRVFLKQIDPWMTFDRRWGRFRTMPTNLVGPSPTPTPTFSSIPQSTTKRIAVHTYIFPYRLYDF